MNIMKTIEINLTKEEFIHIIKSSIGWPEGNVEIRFTFGDNKVFEYMNNLASIKITSRFVKKEEVKKIDYS